MGFPHILALLTPSVADPSKWDVRRLQTLEQKVKEKLSSPTRLDSDDDGDDDDEVTAETDESR